MDAGVAWRGHISALVTSANLFASACRPRQAGCARWTPIDNRRAGAVSQYVTSDLILPGEPDILFSLCVGEEAVEGSNPAGVAGDAIVQADHHHAPSMHALFVKLIEFVAQRLLVSSRIPTNEGKGDDVVHVEGIGDRDEIPPAYRDNKRLVVAWFVDVINKAKILQRLQEMDGVAHPVRVPADRYLAGDLMNRLDAIGDEALFFVTGALIRIIPHPSLRGGFMSAPHDLLTRIWARFARFADHEP